MLGVLGGSGVYSLDGLVGARWEKVESPFGTPSDELLLGHAFMTVGSKRVPVGWFALERLRPITAH